MASFFRIASIGAELGSNVQNTADIAPSSQAATREAIVRGKGWSAQAATRAAVVRGQKMGSFIRALFPQSNWLRKCEIKFHLSVCICVHLWL